MMPKRYLLVILIFLSTSTLYAEEPNLQGGSDQQINDFSLVGYGERGKKTWDLTAKSADIYNDLVKLNDIVGNMYGETEDIKLTSDKGDFDKAQGNVHLEQNVVITTSTGGKLTTNSLDWDRKNEVVTTTEAVNIEKENLLTTAVGAVAQPDLNKITLEKEVTVKINPANSQGKSDLEEKNKIIITCDGPLEIDYEKNIATFHNNVHVDTQDITIDGDVMYVYFRKAEEKTDVASEQTDKTPTVMGGKIEKIITQGNVKIVRGENISYSDEAIYVAAEKKITLLGRPKLVIYSTEDLKEGFDASSGN